MLYLSQLLNAPVEDLHSARIGKIVDVLALRAQVGQAAPAYPTALLIEGEEEQPWRVPPNAVEWHEDSLRLRIPLDQLTVQPISPLAEEVSLAHDVYDKQVIDIERKKTIRVNDVYLGNDWQLLGVDNSTLGLVRRLAPPWLLGERSKHAPAALIPWDDIELVNPHPTGEHEAITPQMLRLQSGHLAELHPADIAEIVHQLTPGQGARLIEGLDDETAADTMEEIDTERQRHILENISSDRAADILETMEPDEAADLLAQLPEDRAQELLNLMQPEESEDVQELLEYEEDTAGGMMTTDYLVLNSTRSVAEALEAIRLHIQEQDVRSAYVYCVEDETQDECPLLGTVSVWDLLVANPTQHLQELMETDVITV
ncbi:MAG: hypothetical protein M3Z24_08640, partial [Chloroflexota bacterium]|nr:hypothetical protein [Chloroflexota bacterium]